MKAPLNLIPEGHIIIPIIIILILSIATYIISLIHKTKKEKKMIQEIAELAKTQEKKKTTFDTTFSQKRQDYEKKHETYTSFIIFLDNTHFNMNTDAEKTEENIAIFKQKLAELNNIASEEVKHKLSEYLALNENYRIDTKPLKTAMQKELTYT